MRNPQMSALRKYLEVQDEFHRQMISIQYNINRQQQFYSTGRNIDSSKDVNGRPITKEHPYYELSQVIASFQKGEYTSMNDLDVTNENLEQIFREKGSHFTAGYLSRFGKVEISNYRAHQSFGSSIKWGLRKLKERAAYEAAMNVWNEYQDKKLQIQN